MLVQLHIENYALVERAVVEFGPGFNVLTGETGAGKSLIIGALGLALIPVLFTYAGWNAAAYIASEVREPESTVPEYTRM